MILGSVDFLGNPVGLLTDISSGVSGMIATQPDVMGLVRDVTHGMSDTASKVWGGWGGWGWGGVCGGVRWGGGGGGWGEVSGWV